MTSEDRPLIEILEEDVPVGIAKGKQCWSFSMRLTYQWPYVASSPPVSRLGLPGASCQSRSLTDSALSRLVRRVCLQQSTVHRANALDACKFVIDEIKASVPIWKKEVHTDGEVWKENKEFLVRIPDLGKGARFLKGGSENNTLTKRGHAKSTVVVLRSAG